MLTYHRLYDIYNTYDGIVNLKNVNDNAGIAPVEVDQRIIDLILFSKEIYKERFSPLSVLFPRSPRFSRFASGIR